jgi:hypothetical protein
MNWKYNLGNIPSQSLYTLEPDIQKHSRYSKSFSNGNRFKNVPLKMTVITVLHIFKSVAKKNETDLPV